MFEKCWWKNKILKMNKGNVRVSYVQEASSLKVMDTNNYYPFGLSWLNPTTGQSVYDPLAIPYNYKFLNRELQEFGGYDLQNRFYFQDAVVFGQHDPLSEKTLQPYAYGYGNPVRYTDANGLSGKDWYKNNLTQNIEWHDGSKEIEGYTNITKEAAGRPMAVIEKDGGGNVTATNWLNNDGSITSNGETIMNGYSTTTVLGRTITSRNPWESIVNAEGGNGVPFNLTWRNAANGMETTGTAIEVAGIAGLIPSEGTSSVLLPIGSALTTGGVVLNAGLDYSEGNKAEAYTRVAIHIATMGLGKLIKSASKSAELNKSSQKILEAHSFIYGEIADKTRGKVYKK